MNKKIVSSSICFLLLLFLTYLLFHIVKAGLVSNFSDQLNGQIIASAANHTIMFKTSSDFGPNQTLELYFEQDFDLSLIDYTDIDFKANEVDFNLGSSPGAGSGSNLGVSVSGQAITFTQNDTDTVVAGSNLTIAIGLNADYQIQGDKQIYNPTAAGTYRISLSGSFGDMGTISLAVLNSDSVALSASVTPELSFAIRNAGDSDYSNACSLGTIASFGVSECSYRLAAETNASQGWQIYIKADNNFRNSQNYIANIGEGAEVTEGQEGYGIAILAGTNIIKEGDFNTDDTPIPSQETLLLRTNSVYNYKQGETSTSSLIIHRVAVSALTKAGIYNQHITYSIIANY